MDLRGWLIHLFVPHSSNNHRAKILHPASLSIIVALFLVSQFFLNFFTLVSPAVLGFASNITPEKVIELTNQKRLEQGLEPLKVSDLLNEVARRKAADMFAFNYWAHVSPSGRDPWSFFKEVGYKYIYAGENLARDFMDSASVVEAWMNSPSHRDNIINPKYKEIGLAVVNGTLNGIETTLVVQVFGTPLSSALAETKKKESPVKSKPEEKPSIARIVPRVGEASNIEEKVPGAALALVEDKKESQFSSSISPFGLTKIIAIFLLGIILGALIIDGILVAQHRIVRLSGRNVAHLIFIGFLLLAIILTTPGAIL